MNDDVLTELLRRFGELERRVGIPRIGTITALSPLSMAPGGSAVPYTNVKSVGGPHAVGDVVSFIVYGNDLIVLGKIGGLLFPGAGLLNGPWDVTSGTITPGNEGTVQWVHNTNRTAVGVLAWIEDGSYAAGCSMRVDRTSNANAVNFIARNNGANDATVKVRGWIVWS